MAPSRPSRLQNVACEFHSRFSLRNIIPSCSPSLQSDVYVWPGQAGHWERGALSQRPAVAKAIGDGSRMLRHEDM
eukprot:8636594-Alexandrium_andersonii.AAC.1